MNYNKIIEPFVLAVAKTKGIELPPEPVHLVEKARRFLSEMVLSEMLEYELAITELDRIDALADAIIYITDSCLRHGITPHVDATFDSNPEDVADRTWAIVKRFVKATTLGEQTQALSYMLSLLANGHDFDLAPFIVAVTDANLQKINTDGTVTLNEAGKVMKPDNFVSPDLSQILMEVKNG